MSLSFKRAALLGLGLAAASLSCVVIEDDFPLEPALEFEGVGVGHDPTAHFAIDFGMVAVGSSSTPEVFAFNAGSAKLIAQLEAPGTVPTPFELASTSIELNPKERKAFGFTFSPGEVGTFETIITFRTNETEEQVKTVRLTGQGIPSELFCAPTEVHIGDVVKGETRPALATCTNPLAIPITIQLGALLGPHRPYFSAELLGGDGTQAEIPAGGSIDVKLEFHADNISGAASVTLPILDEGGQTLVTLSIHANAVEHALQVRYEEDGERFPLVGCYRFPATDVGTEEVRALYVRNLSRNPIHLEDLRLDRDGDHFSIVSPRLDGPILVPADGATDIEILLAFHPKTASEHTQLLILHSDDDRAPVSGIRACMEGQGIGSRLSCTPDNLDFGPVGIGMSVTREYTCENTAGLREGVPPQILYVDRVETTVPNTFSAVLVNPDGTRGPNPKGYYPGEGFRVLVTYTPGPLESFDSAEIIVHNFSSANPQHLTQVVGQGRELAACVFDVSPPSLRFGVVAPGDQRTLTSYVINHLETDCIISDLRLSPGTDPAFSMDEVASAIVPGRGRFPITVTFAPTGYASSLTGAAEFTISDPTNPEQSVALSGISQTPCLEIHPAPIDFGGASPYCSGHEVFVSVANTCATTLQIDDITIPGAYGQFVLRSLPPLPLQLEAGDRTEFSAYFRPGAVGLFEGAVVLEVSDLGDGTRAPTDAGPYTLPLKGEGTHDPIQTDTFSRQETGKIDVLWVVDNSTEMSSVQSFLYSNGPAFMSLLTDAGVDFQVGVTSSGVSYALTSGCPGGYDGNEDGRLYPHPDMGLPRILKSSMPGPHVHTDFARNLQVGTCHDSSSMYEAARRALSAPWVHTPEAQGGNLGFLRSDAALSIVLVTNGDDMGSRWDGGVSQDNSVARYLEFFQNLKPGRHRSVKIHSVSGGAVSCTNNGGAKACPRCLEGVDRTGGVWLDVCSTQGVAWDEAFRDMLQGVGFHGGLVLRGQPADRTADGKVDHEDIEVRVNGRRRPAFAAAGDRVWQYHPLNNSISFHGLHVPAAHDLVEVTYMIACFDYD